MSSRILVPFDASDPSKEALEYAIDQFPDATLVALMVVDTSAVPFIPNAVDESDDEVQEMLGEASDQLETAESIADEHGVSIETRTSVGSPAQEIVEFAEDESVNQIVIGSHGRSGVTRILLGSVAEVVVRHSPVPVIVVR